MKYIYIDYENLNTIEKLIKIQGKYFFFIGENQAKINSSLVYSTNGIDVTWIKISGSGKNALDFHIAYYLAKNDLDKNIEHFILSKDTGFDPLIKHLKSNGIKVKRIDNLSELSSKKTKPNPVKAKKIIGTSDSEHYERAIKILTKTGARHRPQTLEKFKTHIKSQFKTLPDTEVKKIIDQFIKNKVIICDENSKIKYSV